METDSVGLVLSEHFKKDVLYFLEIYCGLYQSFLPSEKMTDAWKHYTLNKGKTVTCKICGNTSQYSSSKTGMRYHLDKKHGIKKETQEKLTTKSAIVNSFIRSKMSEKGYDFPKN